MDDGGVGKETDVVACGGGEITYCEMTEVAEYGRVDFGRRAGGIGYTGGYGLERGVRGD